MSGGECGRAWLEDRQWPEGRLQLTELTDIIEDVVEQHLSKTLVEEEGSSFTSGLRCNSCHSPQKLILMMSLADGYLLSVYFCHALSSKWQAI